MITQLFKNLEKGVRQFNDARIYLTNLIRGTNPQRDKDLTRKFVLENKKKLPAEELINRKLESMKDSQGVSGFTGSSHKGPGKVNHDKIISNKRRGARTKSN